MSDKKLRKTDAEARALVMDLRIIDDTFFEEYIRDADACEELLQVVLENPKLRIKRDSLDAQKSVHIVGNRSVRVDAYVEGQEGTIYNIEIQRANSCNHVRRVRYNASAITVKHVQPGDAFDDVPDVLVIYISEFDLFHAGKTIYHVESVVRETGEVVDDGQQSIYVNTVCKDGSKLSDLMTHFTEKDFSDEQFPKSSKRMHELKHDERMVTEMCKAVQEYAERYAKDYVKEYAEKYAKDYAKEYAERYAKDCAEQERIGAICNMIELGLTKEQVLKKYSESEYAQAEQALETTKS